MGEKGKTTDGLMRHIRSKHNISISGSSHKRTLKNIGYYHGYKAYKFVKSKTNNLNFTTFDEIKKTYDFDNGLKSLLYSEVMRIETAVNNYTLEELVANSETHIDYIFKHKLNHFDDFPNRSTDYTKEMWKHLNLRKNIEGTIAKNYTKSPIIQHYVHKNQPVPMWAIFEHTTLGDLGSILERANNDVRRNIQTNIGCIDISLDPDYKLLSKHIYIIKDLRNAIAHNNVIFDCRFLSFSINRTVIMHLEKHTKIKNINFQTITDYIILITYYLMLLKFSKKEILAFVKRYDKIINDYYQSNISQHNIHLILGVDTLSKINKLKSFIKN